MSLQPHFPCKDVKSMPDDVVHIKRLRVRQFCFIICLNPFYAQLYSSVNTETNISLQLFFAFSAFFTVKTAIALTTISLKDQELVNH